MADLLTLRAKIAFDSSEYEKGLNDAEGKARGVGSKIGGALVGGAKALGIAIGAAGGAIGKLIMNSVSAYSEYEQLVGGVNKLYGNMGLSLEDYANSVGQSVDAVRDEYNKLEEAQNLVMQNAKNAFATAGMSASQYMETATSFSAALINSLGGDTVRAAELTDVAMRAMSDNYNTFGGDMANIQNAFQGFAKQNYTMLDNLKLGYGGTKTEMERLISDANEYAESIGQASDLSIDSFADIVQAIELVQEKQKIAGTTAREAATTIQGALGMTKAAWQNLITGLSDDSADVGKLVEDLITSATTMVTNVMPVVQHALEAVGPAIEQAVPVLIDGIMSIVSGALPQLLSSAVSLLETLGNALLDNVDILIQDVLDIMLDLVGHITDGDVIKKLMDGVFELMQVIPRWLSEYSDVIIDAAVDIIIQLTDALTNPDNLVGLIDTALTLILSLADGITRALPRLIEQAPVIIQNLVDAIVRALPLLIDAALQLIEVLTGAILDNLGPLISAGIEILIAVTNGILQMLPELLPLALELIVTLISALISHTDDLILGGIEIVKALIEGIVSMLGQIAQSGLDIVGKFLSVIVNSAKQLWDAGKNMVEGIYNGIKEKIENAKQWGRDLINNFLSGIKEKWENLKSTVSDVAKSVKDFLGFSEPEKGPLSDFHTYAPDMMDLFAKGIRDNTDVVRDQLTKSFAFDDLMHPELTVLHTKTSGGETQETILVDLRNVLNRLQAIPPGALVGMIASEMDYALGQRAVYAGRNLA